MCAYWDKQRKHWVADFLYEGERITKRGFHSKTEARQHEGKEKEKLKQQSLTLPVTDYDLRKVMSLYLDSAQRLFVEQTYKYKRRVLVLFLKYTGPCLSNHCFPPI